MIDTKVKNFLEKVLGPGDSKSKDNVAFRCPFCHHPKKKLEIKLDKSASDFGYWHCWVCNKAGHNLFSLIRKINVKNDYISILSEILGKKKPFVKQKTNLFEKEDIITETHFLPKEFKSLYIKSRQPEYKRALYYVLNDRKLTGYDILRYNIGYCESGRYSGRIIVPSYDENGKLNFFVARSFIGHSNPYDTPPWGRDIIGFEILINWKEPLILTEGVFDAITIGRNAIPLFGKFLSQKLKMRIFEEEVKDIFIALDLDARKEIVQIAEYLMNQGINVYILNNMKDKDPNVIGRKRMLELIYSEKMLTRNEILKIKILERI